MVDLGGYVIILVETKDKQVKLYGSPAEKSDLEVADEILEINGESLINSKHTEVISHIHKCIKSRTICLRVKRRTGNKLAKELAEHSHVQDAFVIAVEQQARERLERLSALRKIKPVDMTKLSQQLCDSPPSTSAELEKFQQDHPTSPANTIYSAPVSELGSTVNLNKIDPHDAHMEGKSKSRSTHRHSNHNNNLRKASSSSARASHGRDKDESVTAPHDKNDEAQYGGYMTDEELELCQTIDHNELNISQSSAKVGKDKQHPTANQVVSAKSLSEPLKQAKENEIQSPSKEVLIADNGSRRSSKASIQNFISTGNGNGIVHNADRKTSIKNGQQQLKMVEEEARLLKEQNAKNSNMSHSISKKQSHKPLAQTVSLKAIVDHNEMLECLSRVQQNMTPDQGETKKSSSTKQQKQQENLTQSLQLLTELVINAEFQKLLRIHNTIQSLQCFQCPPMALCSDSRSLASDCISSLNNSVLPEVAEMLQLLQKIDFEALLFAHDKLAQRQSALPWEKCVAEMWTKDRPLSATSSISGLCEMATLNSSTAKSNSKETLNDETNLCSTNNAESNLTKQKSVESSEGSRGIPQHEFRKLSSPSDVTRVVKIMKQNEPLGATVRNEGERVVIGRVVKGGAAERSGHLHPGDEVLEVNGLKLKGKSVHDICDTLCQMTGTLTFVIIPCGTDQGGQQQQVQHQAHKAHHADLMDQEGPSCGPQEEVLHFRAHFNYNPDDDLYIPCHELGISFQRGDILHVINREDQHWWQAYRDGEWTQTLAGLIPSLALQQHRVALQKQKREQDLKEQREIERNSPAKKKSQANSSTGSLLCARKSNKRKRLGSPFKKADRFAVPPYEEMSLYYPQPNQRRPLILVGPPSIGRHELRLRLLGDVVRFAAAVPHTSRTKGDSEIDGQDYNFVSRSQFEEYVASKRFVEHGEFDKQYYGTSLDAVRTVINSGKICVLNLQPGSLQILHDSDLKPYVVFLTPPNLHTYRQQRQKYGEAIKEDEYRESVVIATEMEDHYGHYFDSVIPFDDIDYVYEQLVYEINLLEREPQWVPAKWVRTVPLSCG